MTLSKERIDDESLQGLIDMRRERVEYCKEEGLRASLILNEAMLSALTELLERRERRERDKHVSLGLLSVQQARPLKYGRQMHSDDNCDDCSHYRSDICHGDKCAAPPAPVVPEEMPAGLAGQIVSLCAFNIRDKELAQKIWNACRAAALNQTHVNQASSNGQSFGNAEQLNYPVTPDGWIKCSERMPASDGNYWGWWSESKRQGPVWFIKSEVQAQFQSSEITHWMPLPAAPKQESE